MWKKNVMKTKWIATITKTKTIFRFFDVDSIFYTHEEVKVLNNLLLWIEKRQKYSAVHYFRLKWETILDLWLNAFLIQRHNATAALNTTQIKEMKVVFVKHVLFTEVMTGSF